MNKRIFLLFALGCLLFTACSASHSSSDSIAWLDSLDQGLSLAQEQKKPVMIDFYTGWCGFCKKLDSETFSNPQVTELAEKFVCVKVNGDDNSDIIKKYGIRGFPTIVFLNWQGQETERVVGFRPATAFAPVMNRLLN